MPQHQKSEYRTGFKKWSDDKAIALRKSLGLSAYSPLCAFKLCEYLKIQILEPKQVAGMTDQFLNSLLITGSNNWSAATIPLENGKFIIIHNPTHSYLRQQSNLMHELAHIICEHKIESNETINTLSNFLRVHNQKHEQEAEWFGACLQLPRPALYQSLMQSMTIEEISSKYNASIEMVKYRINITGLNRQLRNIASKN